MFETTNNSVALLKLEPTYGIDANPAAANAMMLMDIQIATVADKLERKVAKPFLGSNPFVLVNKRITLDAKCDLIGNITPGLAAPLGPVYRIAGHKETLVAGPPSTKTLYTPISRGFESGTLYFYWADILFKMTGVRGGLDFDYMVRQYALGTLKLTGLFQLPEDGEVPTGINWDAFQTPEAIEMPTWDVTIKDGASPAVVVNAQQIQLSSNAKVEVVEGSARREAAYKDRAATGTLKVFKDDTLANWNPWALADSKKVLTLTNTILGGAGRNVDHPMRVQLEYPKPADLDGGVAGFEIPFTAIPSGTGGDEYSIALS